MIIILSSYYEKVTLYLKQNKKGANRGKGGVVTTFGWITGLEVVD